MPRSGGGPERLRKLVKVLVLTGGLLVRVQPGEPPNPARPAKTGQAGFRVCASGGPIPHFSCVAPGVGCRGSARWCVHGARPRMPDATWLEPAHEHVTSPSRRRHSAGPGRVGRGAGRTRGDRRGPDPHRDRGQPCTDDPERLCPRVAAVDRLVCRPGSDAAAGYPSRGVRIPDRAGRAGRLVLHPGGGLCRDLARAP